MMDDSRRASVCGARHLAESRKVAGHSTCPGRTEQLAAGAAGVASVPASPATPRASNR